MGALGVAQVMGIVSPSYAVYRPLSSSLLLPDFSNLLLRTRSYVAEYVSRSTGIRSSRLRLYPEQFLQIPLFCPPVPEQQAIIAHVQESTAEVDSALATTAKEVALIREYRTRLMADVVTGKLDVREAAARLPEEPEELVALEEIQVLEGEEAEDEALEAVEAEAGV